MDDIDFKKLENFFNKEIVIDKPIALSEFVIFDGGTEIINFGGDIRFHKFKFIHKDSSHLLWISPTHWSYRYYYPHYLISCLGTNKRRSLQIDLDRFVDYDDKSLILTHDGSMTAGNKGRIQSEKVRQAVEEIFPELIIRDDISLGRIIMSRNEIEFNNVSDVLIRLFKYCLVREKLRSHYRQNHI